MNNKFRELNHDALMMIWERELLLAHRLHSGHHRLAVDPRTFALFDDYRNFIRAHRHQHGPTILDFSAAPPGLHSSFYLQAAEESGGHPHHVGGKRWSPTQEQLGVLETLYRKGMRTPSAQQIDRITAELVKYGRVEGKNVFYWFQNHKTRERQRERLDTLPPKPSATAAAAAAASTSSSLEIVDSRKGKRDQEFGENSGNKRKRRSWFIDLEGEISNCEEVKKPKTLELFPLHPSR